MHISFGVLMVINATLSRGLLGANPYTGEKNEPIKELPTGIFRHLRRLHKAVKDELEIIAPEHNEFIKKWAVDGQWPTPQSENYAEFDPAYNEFFGTPDIVLPFATPFELGLIDPKTVIPVDIMNIMENINDTIADDEKQKETPPATVVSDTAPQSATPDA
jgi:hypothetical protein